MNGRGGSVFTIETGSVSLLGINFRKRQQFSEKYATSATGHLWAHLLNMGKPVAHLVDLVDAVHANHQPGSDTPIAPLWAGLWSDLRHTWETARAQATNDLDLYHSMLDWLDQYEANLGLDTVVPIDWEQVAGCFPPDPGTYAVFMETAAPGGVLIGRHGTLGRLEVLPGFYVYTGSAGKKGTGVRDRQHWHLTLAGELKLKWQVDFLRLRCSVREVWFTTDPFPSTLDLKAARLARECSMAMAVLGMRGAAVPMRGFGASDCRRCPAHLAHFRSRPSFRSFQSAMKRSAVPCHVKRVFLG